MAICNLFAWRHGFGCCVSVFDADAGWWHIGKLPAWTVSPPIIPQSGT